MNDSNFRYDSILSELPNDGSITDPKGIHSVDLHYLSSCGYINIQMTNNGEVFMINLTQNGLKFINEGGFKEQQKRNSQSEYDNELQRINWITTSDAAKNAKILSIISILIATLSLFVAVIAIVTQ